MIKVKIVGAGGFGGVGAVELLLRHSEAEITCLVDIADIGKSISSLYPHLSGYCDIPLVDAEDEQAKKPVDVVFLATPDRVGMKLAPSLLEAGSKVIDYSGDFRFDSEQDYADYAGRINLDPAHASPDLLSQTVYGMPELHRSEINENRKIVGNPGCFAVSCILGLAPVCKERLVRSDSIICDCKTGVSGAGKKPSAVFHYPARYDMMNAYKLAGHQHVCEIERELSHLSGEKVTVTLTPQVVPVCRGIMSTLYADLTSKMTSADAVTLYRRYYSEEPFIFVLDRSAAVGSMHVRGTNRCNLVVDVDERTNRLRVISYIDNLVKGQAGCAVQNMNLLFGLPEKIGLDMPAQYP
jgi:N-acetyl-gamma-glutamyl-phosphate reductase